MGFNSVEIARDQWPDLRDLYASDRTNLTGFDLIEYFVNYKPSSSVESIKIYTTDKDWITHDSYILIRNFGSKANVFFDTIKGSLEDLTSLLCSLNLKVVHLICGYGERLKPVVEKYWLNLGQKLCKLEHLGTIVYHLPSSEISRLEPSLNPSANVHYLSSKYADLVDKHSAYRSADSVTLIKGLMENNLAAGVFDEQGEPYSLVPEISSW
ncbi:uncharacterized protein LOC108106066 isoform X2 [Drosophila eugracilis]|uniref:uncharacterized protein LOC108106066 isoform X2 n=1 Tax=Drosophila eugracilis TaxID=29029 RepID=UPI001BDADFCD|nr:uncharacterized protein LOC108106066 isoform X2 [Drosophila eugracilis]